MVKKLWHRLPEITRHKIIKRMESRRRLIKQRKIKKWTIKLKGFKNRAEGKRCFIIGNGPSLQIRDLVLLKDEDCFAVNRIFQIFDKTDWRPTYYCVTDIGFAEDYEKITEISKELPVFVNGDFIFDLGLPYANTMFPFFREVDAEGRNYFKFSRDISKRIYAGITVVYACIQIAVYMGYTEIYLLGCDCNYVLTGEKDGTTGKWEMDGVNSYGEGLSNPHKWYMREGTVDRMIYSFASAKWHTERLGVSIVNCTRGGKLEVFERRSLEEVLMK